MEKTDLTQARVKELLEYHPEIGVFIWRVSPNKRILAGTIAGGIKRSGYRVIQVDHVDYLEHRLVWFYCEGVWPKAQLDHINGVRSANYRSNLREATAQENRMNNKKQSNNSSGVTGVYWHSPAKKWCAQIAVNRRTLHLGLFIDIASAKAVYDAKAKELFGEFRRIA